MATDTDGRSVPPWTPEEVAALNAYQRSAEFHPFTCGKNRTDAAHKEYQARHPDQDYGQLVATPTGWMCPVPACGYTQGWAHPQMIEIGSPQWK